MRKRLIGCLIAFAALVVLVMFLGFLVMGSIASGWTPGDKIAHIDVEGIITGAVGQGIFGSGESMVDRIRDDLERARKDESVKAIVLRVNTPGGEVTASDTIYHAVKQTAEVKPVVVFMDSLAASGGYYVACGAEEIIANETTITGSIGVIIQTLNYYDLLGKVGLEALVFKSGKFKDSLSGARDMSPEEEAYVQDLVQQMYDRFLEIVSSGRGIPVGQLRDGIADGRVFTGKEALEKKLVDANGYVEDAYERARELGGSSDAEVKRYRRETGFIGLLTASLRALVSGAQSAGGRGRLEIDLSDRLLPRLEPGMVYLLPSYYVP